MALRNQRLESEFLVKKPCFWPKISKNYNQAYLVCFVIFIGLSALVGCGGDQNEKSTTGEDSVSLQSQNRATFDNSSLSSGALSFSLSFEKTGPSSQTRNLINEGAQYRGQYPIVLPEELPEFFRIWFPQGLDGADMSAPRATAEVGGHEVDLRCEPSQQSGELLVYGIRNLFTGHAPEQVARVNLKVSALQKEVHLILRKSAAPLTVRSLPLGTVSERPAAVVSPLNHDNTMVPLRRFEFANPSNSEMIVKLNRSPRGGLFLQYAKVTPFQQSRCAISQNIERWRYRVATRFLMAPSGNSPLAADNENQQLIEVLVPAHGTAAAVLYAEVSQGGRDLLSTRQCSAGVSIPLVGGCSTSCGWYVPMAAYVACGGRVGTHTSDMIKDCLRNTGHSHSGGDFCVQGYAINQNPVQYEHESLELLGRAIEWDGSPPMAMVFYKDIPVALQRGTLVREGFGQALLLSGVVDNETPLRLEPLDCQ